MLDKWRGIIARRIAQLADVMHQETGKPHSDAMLECALAIDHLAWAAKHAERVLSRRKVSSGLLMANQAASVEYRPLGVVGVIGPWNYPVFTPMGSIAYALAAGNAVVFKPSELTPGVAEWLAAALDEVVPGQGVFQVITGFGETGAALCRSGVDKLAFTGSPATGRKIMATCAETLTPVLMEAGGKDAMIVADDADVTAAADAAAWGAFSNAGQTCAGVERVYVHEKVYDDFLAELTRRAREIYAGADPEAHYGPMTLPGQVDIARSHIEDALAKGGRAVVGGPEAIEGRFIQPTVLVDVPEDSLAITDETFAPTVTVTKVRDLDEAVERANSTRYGLGSTVFSKAHGHGARGAAAVGDDRDQRRDLLRRHPRAAVRRHRGVRLRPDPRPRRAQGVHLRQGDRAAADEAGDRADHLRPHREGRQGAGHDRGGAVRRGDPAAAARQEVAPPVTPAPPPPTPQPRAGCPDPASPTPTSSPSG